MEQMAFINDTYISIMGINALFLIALFILLWMMFRGVTNANLHGANTFGKVLHSVISLCVVAFISSTFSNIGSVFNNWALAASESGEELTGGMQQFVDQMGATQYTSGGLFPADPLSIVFVLAILVGLIGGMWMAPAPKD
tara:strand:+ start:299 stop:718 length:420 start_codon:yes stop_codon:yes gene_type:complete